MIWEILLLVECSNHPITRAREFIVALYRYMILSQVRSFVWSWISSGITTESRVNDGTFKPPKSTPILIQTSFPKTPLKKLALLAEILKGVQAQGPNDGHGATQWTHRNSGNFATSKILHTVVSTPMGFHGIYYTLHILLKHKKRQISVISLSHNSLQVFLGGSMAWEYLHGYIKPVIHVDHWVFLLLYVLDFDAQFG